MGRHFAFFVLALALSGAAVPASSQETLRLGALRSYKARPAFLDAYKKGINLAVDEINATGGVLGTCGNECFGGTVCALDTCI